MEYTLPDKVKNVAVLGTGLIGASWAALFLARGKTVTAFDPDPEAAQRVNRYIAGVWPILLQLGQVSSSARQDAIHHVSTVELAVQDVQFVQESGPENLNAKCALYDQIDRSLPTDIVVASSTSGLRISELQRGRVGKARYVVGHPFNPPHLIPLVEVVAGHESDPRIIEWTMEFYRSIGKHPIRLNREVPGHVANRLQAALWREAVHLVIEGVASAADVDAAVTYGPGLRWAIMGPHLVFHLGGGQQGIAGFLDHLGPSFEAWWKDLGSPHLTTDVRQKVIESVTEESQGRSIEQLESQRDARLLALLSLKSRWET